MRAQCLSMYPPAGSIMEKTSNGILVKCGFDKILPVNGLVRHKKNPNKHPKDQIQRLADIIEYQGWTYPINVSNLTGQIVSGHGRLEAAKLKGWTEVPVKYIDFENDDQEYACVVSDNSIASWAELDFSFINGEIQNLGPEFNIDLLGR